MGRAAISRRILGAPIVPSRGSTFNASLDGKLDYGVGFLFGIPAMLFFMHRGGRMGYCGGGHSQPSPEDDKKKE
jgi:hypothetical protein